MIQKLITALVILVITALVIVGLYHYQAVEMVDTRTGRVITLIIAAIAMLVNFVSGPPTKFSGFKFTLAFSLILFSLPCFAQDYGNDKVFGTEGDDFTVEYSERWVYGSSEELRAKICDSYRLLMKAKGKVSKNLIIENEEYLEIIEDQLSLILVNAYLISLREEYVIYRINSDGVTVPFYPQFDPMNYEMWLKTFTKSQPFLASPDSDFFAELEKLCRN